MADHSEVRFVSLAGVDLSGHDTDEKIPVGLFLEDIGSYLHGGVQTDGSSVVLPGIATLNDAKVDMIADKDVSWFVDYNYENISAETGLPTGTLRIPAFLSHNGEFVCSRALLRRADEHFSRSVRKLLADHPPICAQWHIRPEDVAKITLAAATEVDLLALYGLNPEMGHKEVAVSKPP